MLNVSPDDVTERIHLPGTVWEAKHALVLRPEGDEVPHGGLGAPLGHGPQELAALGESDGVISALELWILSQHLTDLPHLEVILFLCDDIPIITCLLVSLKKPDSVSVMRLPPIMMR